MVNINSLHVNILQNYWELLISFLLIISVQAIIFYKGNDKIYELVTPRPAILRWGLYISYVVFFLLLAINRQQAFIYFQF